MERERCTTAIPSSEQPRCIYRANLRKTAGLAIMGSGFLAAEIAIKLEEMVARASQLLPRTWPPSRS